MGTIEEALHEYLLEKTNFCQNVLERPVDVSKVTMQCKTIDLVSAHKLLQTASEDIVQFRRSSDLVQNQASIIAFTLGLPRQF